MMPFPPGQATDIMAPSIAKQLAQRLGQPFAIDNRAGGAFLPGMALIGKSIPDDPTLGMPSAGPLGIDTAVMSKLPREVERDFIPIALALTTRPTAVVHPAAVFTDLAVLIVQANTTWGQLDYVSGGPRSSLHSTAEALCHQAGLEVSYIPDCGSTPAMTDISSGNVKRHCRMTRLVG